MRFVDRHGWLFLVRMETDLSLWRLRRAFHQFANGVEDDFELLVVLLFHVLQLLCEFGI